MPTPLPLFPLLPENRKGLATKHTKMPTKPKQSKPKETKPNQNAAALWSLESSPFPPNVSSGQPIESGSNFQAAIDWPNSYSSVGEGGWERCWERDPPSQSGVARRLGEQPQPAPALLRWPALSAFSVPSVLSASRSCHSPAGQSPRALSELLKQHKLSVQWEVGLALECSLQASSAIVPLQHAACASIPGGRGDAELQHNQLT